MWGHGVEFGSFACVDHELAITEGQANSAVEDEEPVVAGWTRGSATRRAGSRRIFTAMVLPVVRLSIQVVRSPRLVGHRSDDHVVVAADVEQASRST